MSQGSRKPTLYHISPFGVKGRDMLQSAATDIVADMIYNNAPIPEHDLLRFLDEIGEAPIWNALKHLMECQDLVDELWIDESEATFYLWKGAPTPAEAKPGATCRYGTH